MGRNGVAITALSRGFSGWFILIIAAFLAAGCSRTSPEPGPSPATDATNYEVKGVIRDLRDGGWKALIAHEEIPEYMEAMTMELAVKDTNELRGLLPGDQVRFRLHVTDDDAWIDQVQRIGSLGQKETPKEVANIEELEPGDLFPDCVLTNQLGEAFRLSDAKGRALAVTFIFTRCPLPTFCPRLNKHFYEVQEALSAAGAPSNWHLLSISFDPEWDTPERLAAHGAGQGQNPAHWSFATGAISEIRRLGGSLGLTFAREGASFNHNVRTVVVNPGGRIQKIFTNNEWKPEEMVAEMKRAMEVQP